VDACLADEGAVGWAVAQVGDDDDDGDGGADDDDDDDDDDDADGVSVVSLR
jgi:hypothetical protein